MSQSAVIRFLSDPRSYGSDVPAVERHETHGAIVFLAGNFAHKLKRAVHYPYMDYSTSARRRAMCEAELRVNRRTAPQLYVEVRPIMHTSNGLRFGSMKEELDQAIDWVVVMRRFQQEWLLEEMRKSGHLTPQIMFALADAIAAFHKSAEPSSAFGGAVGISRVVEENAHILRAYGAKYFEPTKVEQYAALAQRTCDAFKGLLEERQRNGFVRRCHGDLHLNNICLLDGQPVLFDAIEFSEDFSCIDVLYDLAFLLMDLVHHGLATFANAVFNRYLQQTEDYAGLGALPLFLSCRAAVRAHVLAARLEIGAAAPDSPPAKEPASSLDEAIAFLQPTKPRLIAIGGLSGTGKSSIARLIAPTQAPAPGAVILRSDIVRKQIWQAQETERLPERAYGEETTKRVYATIAERATRILASGYSVVTDAVYGRLEERREIKSTAHSANVPFHAFWLSARQGILEQRISARRNDASDATVAVLRKQSTKIELPSDWPTVDASGTIEQVAERIEGLL